MDREDNVVGFNGLQNILDAIYNKDIHIVTGNLPKMLIGAASSIYGFFILFQHFVLYRPTMRYEPVSEVELGPMVDGGGKKGEIEKYTARKASCYQRICLYCLNYVVYHIFSVGLLCTILSSTSTSSVNLSKDSLSICGCIIFPVS
mmetsp:Transcript_14952/g.12424  ORF Transcript_14952/g.12424 Transcript_14952/m.12424 type:complete len:146 (+) Transcript_14952:289-726(+)